MKFAILTRDGRVRSTIEDSPDGTFKCSDSGIAFQAKGFQEEATIQRGNYTMADMPLPPEKLLPSTEVVPYMYEKMKGHGHRVKILDEGETDV